MNAHPLNLAVRLLLELTTLFVVGYWCWKSYDGFSKYFLSIGVPFLLAAVWGVFAVPNDPSRSGKTVIETIGVIRLMLEFLFFILGTIAIYKLGYSKASLKFILVVLLHYMVSYDRVIWLIKQ